MQAFLTIAVRAARKAGDYILRESDKIHSIHAKTPNDYVTNVAQAADRLIIDMLSHSYPDHAFLGEESGKTSQASNTEYQWVIEPIDGITNFIHKVPHWCISIACRYRDKIQVSVVYDPVRDELFSAVRGQGAQLNGKRLRVSSLRNLDESLLATGFPHKDESKFDEYMNIFSRLLPSCSDIRRAGATALDLAYVSAGRFDGFWELGLNEQNTTAGSLLVSEAGGIVGDIKGNPNYEASGSMVAANPKVFKAMLQVMHQD